jgi:hypothetical protein
MVRIVLPLPSGQDRLDQWAYIVHALPWDELVIWSDTAKTELLPRPFRGYAKVQSDIGAFSGDSTLVVLTGADASHLPGEQSLKDYQHPTDATYIFGSDDGRLMPSYFDGLAIDKVYIPTIPDSFSLFSAAAFAITLWDRTVKGG